MRALSLWGRFEFIQKLLLHSYFLYDLKSWVFPFKFFFLLFNPCNISYSAHYLEHSDWVSVNMSGIFNLPFSFFLSSFGGKGAGRSWNWNYFNFKSVLLAMQRFIRLIILYLCISCHCAVFCLRQVQIQITSRRMIIYLFSRYPNKFDYIKKDEN